MFRRGTLKHLQMQVQVMVVVVVVVGSDGVFDVNGKDKDKGKESHKVRVQVQVARIPRCYLFFCPNHQYAPPPPITIHNLRDEFSCSSIIAIEGPRINPSKLTIAAISRTLRNTREL